MSSNGSSAGSSPVRTDFHYGSSIPNSPTSVHTADTIHSPFGTTFPPQQQYPPHVRAKLIEWRNVFVNLHDEDIRKQIVQLLTEDEKLDNRDAYRSLLKAIIGMPDEAVRGEMMEKYLFELIHPSEFDNVIDTWRMNDLVPFTHLDPLEHREYMTRYLHVTCNPDSEPAIKANVNNFNEFFDLLRTEVPIINECTEIRRTVHGQFLFFYQDIRQSHLAKILVDNFGENLYPNLCITNWISARVYTNLSKSPVLYPHNGYETMVRMHVISPLQKTDHQSFLTMHAWAQGIIADYGAPVRTITCEVRGGHIAWATYLIEFYSVEHAMRMVEAQSRIRSWIQNEAIGGIVRVEIPNPSDFLALTELVHPGLRGNIKMPRCPNYPCRSSIILTTAEHYVRSDDVRTTLMLRNLPNGITSFELKYFIDGMARNMYNFLYLRMDFQTGNNVGYGFVNFDDPDAAVAFAHKWQGLTWNINHTTKVAAVSYATTQGKENQIARFRNSGLRLQPAPNRPKLFVSLFDYAEESMFGRSLGEEIPLPNVDNRTKLNRSVMNGRNNGLYSRTRRTGCPSSVQGQFDNGNPHNPPEFEDVFESPSFIDPRFSFAHQFRSLYNR